MTTSLPSEKNRLSQEQSYKIQTLRGLAIIAVVFIHNTPGGVFQVWIRPFMNFGVGLFLFLSGYLSNYQQWNPIKRIKKVLIPYVVWTLIYVLGENINTMEAIPLDFLGKLITANSAPMMYYIFVYCQFALLIPIVDKLGRSKYKLLGFVVSPLEILAIRYLPLLLGMDIAPFLISIKSISCLGWFSYFYAGYLLGNRLIEVKYSNALLVVAFVVSVALQILEGGIQFSLGVANCGTQLKLSAILSGLIFCILAYRYIISSRYYKCAILKKIGDRSFGIYFSHIAIIQVLQLLPLYKQHIAFPINAVITLIVTLICVEIGKKFLGRYSNYIGL